MYIQELLNLLLKHFKVTSIALSEFPWMFPFSCLERGDVLILKRFSELTLPFYSTLPCTYNRLTNLNL